MSPDPPVDLDLQVTIDYQAPTALTGRKETSQVLHTA
jgi:hypothetical protein